MERLTKRDEDGNLCASVHDYIRYAGKLAEYEDLEEQGLLLKLLCKRGDTVYFIKSAFSIAKSPIDAKVISINGIDFDNEVMYSTITNQSKTDRRFSSSDIGKTVFLTQAEAEEVLKRMEREK